MRIRRRHLLVGVARTDSPDEFTFSALSGKDDRATVFDAKCAFLAVESKVCFAGCFIGAVAVIASVGKDRANLPVEINSIGRRAGRRAYAQERHKRPDQLRKFNGRCSHGCIEWYCRMSVRVWVESMNMADHSLIVVDGDSLKRQG
jgi:hypothetical protein